MKKTRTEFSARYVKALRAHLGRTTAARGHPGRKLGRAALAAGLDAPDLAGVHEHAMLTLAASDFSEPIDGRLIKRAGRFLAEVLGPREAFQRETQQANRHLGERARTLRVHTAALAAGNRSLKREIARRKAGEVRLGEATERYRRLFRESQVMQDKLRRLTRQIISAQENERKEISRELHDEVVQTLVGINVALSALGQDAAAGGLALKRKITSTQRLVEHSISAVHQFARELRPAVLDDLGLIPALHAFGQRLAARKRLRIQMTAFGGVEALSGADRTVLFRVAQEALINIARHAHASHVVLDIRQRAGAIEMEISDNGKSFEVEKTLLARNNKRLGLVGMRERIEMIGGWLEIRSSPGQGTTVCARIPFNPPEKNQ